MLLQRSIGINYGCLASHATPTGGEQQRVAIARAIAKNPAVLLCDEPLEGRVRVKA